MTTWIALLRAVNVGGTGKLPMATLKALCDEAGFVDATTYIASGNVVFDSALDEAGVRDALSARLEAWAGKPVGVVLRTAAEMAGVLADNPFPERPGNRTVAIFLDGAPPSLDEARGRRDEEMAPGRREIYVYYPTGMGDSKLRFPGGDGGTARNLNTVAALDRMARERAGG